MAPARATHQQSSLWKWLGCMAALCAAIVLSPTAALAQAEPMVLFTTQPTDLADNPITSVIVGEEYKVQVIVQDIRQSSPALGVFSGATTLTFNDTLSTPVNSNPVVYNSFFWVAQETHLDPGAVSGWAATGNLNSPGNAPQLLFTLRLTATAPGMQSFLPTFWSGPPDEGTFLYGFDPPPPWPENLVYVGSPLQILVPEPSTWVSMIAAVGALVAIGRRRNARFVAEKSK